MQVPIRPRTSLKTNVRPVPKLYYPYRLVLMFGILYAAASIKARGQFSLGLEAGADQNSLLTSIPNRPQVQYKSQNGYCISVPLGYSLSKYISVAAGPGFIQKDYMISRTDNLASSLPQCVRNDYLQLPLMAQIGYPVKKFLLLAEGGGFAGYWISGHVSGTIINMFGGNFQGYNGRYEFSSTRDQRLEAGWTVGGQVRYLLRQGYALYLHYSFFQSLIDTQKSYMLEQVGRYNRTESLTIGLMYSFKK
jgi:Outer membrane protein beta-barrel domain